MKIILWPYTNKIKNLIIVEGVDNNRSMIFHNPSSVTEQFEFIEGNIREFIPSFQFAEDKFKDFKGTLNVFYNSDDKTSHQKVIAILNKHKITFDESKVQYPI